MRTSHWLSLVSSLFVMSFAQADQSPQAEQPAPQVAQPAPQVAQPVMPMPAAPLPNPWVNPIAVPVSMTPGANPYLSQMALPVYGGMPFSFVPYILPNMLPIPGAGQAPRKPYTMHPVIPEEARLQMMQMMMPMMTNIMHMSMSDAMNWMAYKIKAKPGLSFDDVVESMNLRANQLNFKHVGENLMWKDFRAVLNDQTAPRIEVHSYCDIKVGRDLLKISPEFVVFLPCRIAVMEDADKNIWLLMIDWNMDWVGGYEQSMGLNSDLEKGAREIRQKMGEIMRAGANGDL
ncbi:MAG: DUF302 domain-containing protein [Thiobacillaceae bacterium]